MEKSSTSQFSWVVDVAEAVEVVEQVEVPVVVVVELRVQIDEEALETRETKHSSSATKLNI